MTEVFQAWWNILGQLEFVPSRGYKRPLPACTCFVECFPVRKLTNGCFRCLNLKNAGKLLLPFWTQKQHVLRPCCIWFFVPTKLGFVPPDPICFGGFFPVRKLTNGCFRCFNLKNAVELLLPLLTLTNLRLQLMVLTPAVVQ